MPGSTACVGSAGCSSRKGWWHPHASRLTTLLLWNCCPVPQVIQKYGQLDVLVNNAAIQVGAGVPAGLLPRLLPSRPCSIAACCLPRVPALPSLAVHCAIHHRDRPRNRRRHVPVSLSVEDHSAGQLRCRRWGGAASDVENCYPDCAHRWTQNHVPLFSTAGPTSSQCSTYPNTR